MVKLDYVGEWLKVEFSPKGATGNQIRLILRSISGVFYNPKTNNWGVPKLKKPELLRKLEKFIVIDPENPVVGRDWGVPDTLPDDYTPKRPLLPHQVVAFNVLTAYNGVLLADAMGLGKTMSVLTAMEYQHQTRGLKKVLILTKATLTYNWKAECNKSTNQKLTVLDGVKSQRIKKYAKIFHEDTLFYCMSYGTYRTDYPLLQELESYFDVMIIDEAHRAKNPSSKIGRAIHMLPVTYKYALTATPFINRPTESYNLLVWLGVEKRSWWSFQARYAVMGGYNNKEIVGYQNLKELQDLIQSVMLRRTTDILGLEKATEVITVHMSDKQSKAYHKTRQDIKERFELDEGTSSNPLTLLTALRQVAISPRLTDPEADAVSAKLDCVLEMIEDIVDNGEKAIIFTSYVKAIDLMLENETIQSYNPAVVQGKVSAIAKKGEEYSDRQKVADRFQTDPECKVFIGTIEACAEGLTLTAATHVFFLDEDWRETMNGQATGRALRIGTTQLVTEYRIRVAGTVDEYIGATLQGKEDLFSSIIEGKTSGEKVMRDFVKSILYSEEDAA